MDEIILTAICEIIKNGEKAVLVTIISTEGSTPRKAGSKMLVFSDGRTVGTIGGGCGESEVKKQALHVLDIKKSAIYNVVMHNSVAAEEGMVCGGVMELFLQLIQSI